VTTPGGGNPARRNLQHSIPQLLIRKQGKVFECAPSKKEGADKMKYLEILELARDTALDNWCRWNQAYQEHPGPIIKARVDEWDLKLTALNQMILTEQSEA